MEKLYDNGQYAELRKLLHFRLEFGTAGIRGPMGAGYSQMNDLVIIQTSQGLCDYAISEMDEYTTSIVIGYDGRHNSRRCVLSNIIN